MADKQGISRHNSYWQCSDSTYLPLFLNNCGKQFLPFLLCKDPIHMVVMDKLYLSHHFAWSFREEFDQLKDIVFRRLHANTPCIFMTATCSTVIIQASRDIFGFNLNHTDWPLVQDIANRKQLFIASYPVGICCIYNVIETHLSQNKLIKMETPYLTSKCITATPPRKLKDLAAKGS